MNHGNHRAVEKEYGAKEDEAVQHKAFGAGHADEPRLEEEEEDAVQRDRMLHAVTKGLERQRQHHRW
jgi:hypothetical protein